MHKNWHEIWHGWVGCALELQLCGDGFKPWLEQNNFLVKTIFLVGMWRGLENLGGSQGGL